MIRPLRQRHRQMVYALGIVLPVAFVAALWARKPEPGPQPALAALQEGVMAAKQVVWSRADLWTTNGITTRLLSDAAGKEFAVELTVMKEIVKPDLIVYWSPTPQAAVTVLPADAIFLGVLGQPKTTLLPSPKEATTMNGRLIIYALADHEVVAVSQPMGVGKP